ncbi:hypothetical protein [Jannaschia aquimarina]|uniref:Uncharacterized protein n=1 Tax=Jannaschia aquimarina TaxID=935700 RepID=A0A0D1ENF7_9RHOB|nr:hypothetical protein [Jannaschia aquimarina]KIT17205.1 hypothetical protein jaqu_09360 [Jannaschia aquimarina]SNT18382.1 hypothetical protein SAMN05421775_10762 [Jannaschia aquimarina]
MSVEFLLPALAFFTLLAVVGFGIWSQEQVHKRMDDPNARKSTLAADKDSHGTPADV